MALGMLPADRAATCYMRTDDALDQRDPMALTADEIFRHPALEPRVRGQAWSLLLINDADPRMGSLFASQQRWLMAHAALAQYFRDTAVSGAGAGVLAARVLDLVERHQIASRNTAAAFLNEVTNGRAVCCGT